MAKRIGDGKTILLGMPNWFLYHEVKYSLEKLGFTVYGIPFTDEFYYRSLKDRLINLFKKVVYNDRSYKVYLKYREHGKEIDKILNSLNEPIDYGLMIRADFYPIDVMRKIRSKVCFLAGYQWDGLNRYPEIYKSILLFDKFYAFDPLDVNYTTVYPITNFYFEDLHLDILDDNKNLEVYYLGSYFKSRIQKLLSLSKYLIKIGSNSSFMLLVKNANSHQHEANDVLMFSDKYVSYSENLNLIKKSKVLLDIQNEVHNGLSFRVFEAIGYNKKLITDNSKIKEYDFYVKDNIFILDEDNLDELQQFIESDYKELPENIRKKYSFDNWIQYVFNLESYSVIDLPK